MYYCTHITYNQGPFCAECYDQVKTDHELNKALDSALEKMVKNSKNMDPEFQDVINKHFWKILY